MRQKQEERVVVDQTAEPAVNLDDVIAETAGGVLDKVVTATQKQESEPRYGYVEEIVGYTGSGCSMKPIYEKRRVRLN